MAIGHDDTLIASLQRAQSRDLPDLIAGRYRIVRWLGSGGMGRVYEAVDIELGVHIALKVLRGGLTDDGLQRFRREVRLTRRVQHRNVARMFDIGDHEGDRFLTMELVEGNALSKQLGAPTPWPRLKPVAIQICEGIEAAHAVGVIHRDLKPDNILIERDTDRAVITDFGIARSIDDAGMTREGSVIGTPRYMAPEQLSGQAIDRRSDLFSLAVVLYELANGSVPWPGDNVMAIAVAQARQPVPQLAFSALPTAFTEIVMRCLAIDPDSRPQSASEVLAALRAANAVPATTVSPPTGAGPRLFTMSTEISAAQIVKLAVLPIVCEPADEYLADGLHEDLVDILSTTPSLRVRPAGIARGGTAQDPRELGRVLEVDHIVSGSLRRTPSGAVRVSARLLSVADGFQIWAQRIDCSDAELLATSDALARDIATSLSTRATASMRPTNPRSVDLYLRARAELRRYWGGHMQVAADLLDQAHELSPTSVPIAGARALATVQAWVLQREPSLLERAKIALEVGLRTGHPEAQLAAAQLKINTGDPIGAANDLASAIVRAPMLSQAHEMAGRILVEVGAETEARQHFETAIALDASRRSILEMDLARLDMLEGWWERANARVQALLQNPDHSMVQFAAICQARFAMWRGDAEMAKALVQQFAQRMGPSGNHIVDYVVRTATDDQFDPAIWNAFLDSLGGVARPRRPQLMALQLMSERAILLGHRELGLVAIEEADRCGLLDVSILDRCPLYDSVRNSPRFRQARDRVAERAAGFLAAFRATAG